MRERSVVTKEEKLKGVLQKGEGEGDGINLHEELEIFSNVDKIQIAVEAENMDTAARTACIEDDGVGPRLGLGVRRSLAVSQWVPVEGIGGARRAGGGGHEEENKEDEEQRDRDHKDYPSKAVDLVRQGFMLPTGTFHHFLEFLICMRRRS